MLKTPGAVLFSISKWLFLAVVFLVPIVVVPWTSDAYEINKQLILTIGISLAAICFMLSAWLERRAVTRIDALLLAPIGLLVVTSLSAMTSLSPVTSWLGQGGQEYASVISLVGFIILFFLGRALFSDRVILRSTVQAVFVSSAIICFGLLFSVFGFELGFAGNLIGTPLAAAVYLLTLSMFGCAWWLKGNDDDQSSSLIARRTLFATMSFTFVTTIGVLLALDSTLLWALTLCGSSLLFAVAFGHADKFQSPLKFLPSMTLFVLALIFIVLPTHFPSPFSQEVTPNLATTWTVVNGAWNDGSVWLGTGPGTFALPYAKYVALDVNQSEFWNVIFDRGNAQVSTVLATVGVLGVLAWLFFVVLCLVLAIKKILAAASGWRELLPSLAAYVVLTIAACFYTQNFTLVFLFWLLAAMLASRLGEVCTSTTVASPRARLTTALVTIVTLVVGVTTILLTSPRYAAEVAFAKAVELNVTVTTATELESVIGLLDRSAKLNPYNDVYYRNLAGALLRRLSLLSAEEAADSDYVQSLIRSTITAATRATELAPLNVLNWEAQGLIYRELVPVLPDAAEPAVAAYVKATELSPINPRYKVEAARAYLAIVTAQTPFLTNDDADVASAAKLKQEQSLSLAEDQLRTAIALKPDYVLAYYYLALLQERQGKLAEAVRGLELVRQASPEDVGVGLQLGMLYLRQGKNELAQAELQRVIELAPTYANAHWYLSVVLEQQGDLKNAIKEVEKVLESNPGNVTVQTRLDRLKAGEKSEVIPEPVISEPVIPTIP